jgi:hypothetical protein
MFYLICSLFIIFISLQVSISRRSDFYKNRKFIQDILSINFARLFNYKLNIYHHIFLFILPPKNDYEVVKKQVQFYPFSSSHSPFRNLEIA